MLSQQSLLLQALPVPLICVLTMYQCHADLPPWQDLQSVFHETWYIDCDVDTAMERVFERQVGHGRTPEVARWRVENNDRKNALLIAETAARANLLVPSLPEQ